MADKKTLTFALMDAPYESTRNTTAFRLMQIAASRGYNINVFAYEGAVMVPFALQEPHPNAVHGRDVEEERCIDLVAFEVIPQLVDIGEFYGIA